MPTIRDIEHAVCTRFKMTGLQMRELNNKPAVARPRQIAMFLAKEMTTHSFPSIGTHFCRDHSTVFHAVERIKAMMETNPKIQAYVDECRTAIAMRGDSRREWFLRHAAMLAEGQVSWPADRVPDGVAGD